MRYSLRVDALARAFILLATFSLCSFPFLALAQDVAPTGTVSCFDYYSFGSVQAKLSAPIASTVSGANITFSGTLENANAYPVVDGALYVKVFKTRGATNDGNGPDVVDQFFVKDTIAIPANGSVPISFQWKVPAYAASGDYQLAAFFTTAHKFNLLGLSFTDDIVGNTVPFTVVAEQDTRVAFDKAGVTVNGTPYFFAAFPPRVGVSPATVAAAIRNTSNGSARANVTWKVYQWDAQQEANLVQQEHTSVIVPGNGTAPVSVTVRDAAHSVYLVVGELSWKDTKSIIGARFVREGIDQPRINFPSITSFPLKAGEETTLFSCLHNAGEHTVSDGRLDLTLKDKLGRMITEYSYSGNITSAMMGVKNAFTPAKNYDYAVLDAKLYKGDALVDETNIVYDCSAIDPSQCTPPSFLEMIFGSGSALASAIGLVVLILAAGMLVLWFRRYHSAPPPVGATQSL